MRRIEFFPLQSKIVRLLLDGSSQITELLIGGGAGGAKSFTGCVRLCTMCCTYPGTRRLLGRSELTALKMTTYNTFLDVARDHFGLTYGADFRLSNNNVIKFRNGSEIVLIDMKLYPNKDPNFDKLGSTEFTGGFLDEVNQICWKGYQVASTRVGRYKNDKYGIRGMLLSSCNPAKNRVYKEFYRKQKLGLIDKNRMFIQVLAKHNPNIPKAYLEKLSKMPNGPMKERLFFGNREYDDTPGVLFAFNDVNSFMNRKAKREDIKSEKYLVCDVARHGIDKTTVTYWEGMQGEILRMESSSDMDKLQHKLEQEAIVRGVKLHNIIVDEDGVGGGVVDGLGCTGFLNNGSVIPDEDGTKPNFQNLKTQCYFALAKYIKDGIIGLTIPDFIPDKSDPNGGLYKSDLEEMIQDELGVVKEEDIDKDGKRRITSKKDMKESLGRSPDWSDNLMMRMLPLIQPDDDMSWAMRGDQ